MDIKTISIALVAIMVGAVAFGAILPTFQDVTATEDTYNNSGFFYANYLTAESTDTLSWDPTKPAILTVNNVDVDTSGWNSSYSNVTVAFSNKWFIRFATDTHVIYLYDVDTDSSSSTDYASPSNQKTFNLICSAGTATITIGETEYTETIAGDGLIISNNNLGPYVMKKSTTKAYVLGDSLVYGSGRTDRALGEAGTSTNIMYKASVDDGAVLIGISPNTYTVTGSTVTYNKVEDGHNSLYQLSNFKIDLTDGENTGSLTYNQIFVPSSVNAERSVHGDSGFNTIVNLIPLVIGMGLLLIAVSWFVVRKF